MVYYCNICKKTISEDEYHYSKEHFNKPLCRLHQKSVGEEEVEQKPFLVQLTEFIDVVGKHGIGVAMVGMGLLFVLFMHPETNSWQNIVAYCVAIPSIIFGSYIEFLKLKVELMKR